MGALEQIAVPLLVGFIGGGVGVFVGYAVLKEKVLRLERDISDHKDMFRRVVFRDACDKCGSNGQERHSEVLRRIEGLEASFRSCFDDLVSALKA